jgi:hypothetical protein
MPPGTETWLAAKSIPGAGKSGNVLPVGTGKASVLAGAVAEAPLAT